METSPAYTNWMKQFCRRSELVRDERTRRNRGRWGSGLGADQRREHVIVRFHVVEDRLQRRFEFPPFADSFCRLLLPAINEFLRHFFGSSWVKERERREYRFWVFVRWMTRKCRNVYFFNGGAVRAESRNHSFQSLPQRRRLASIYFSDSWNWQN